ncbi:MAG TPA: hypothetical protein VGR07_19985 [Thermoanaerobaculia bacterium]|jgi:hypothetical protein|nr:hypothetical protein [Thermoanaerobaculia bacterium]
MPHLAEHRPSTLDRWLAVVEPHLPVALLDCPARKRLNGATHHLPADSLGVIEVRLAPDEPEVDLSIGLNQPYQARQMAGQLSPCHADEFLSRWAEGKWEQLPTLWLEFDLNRGAANRPPPLLCAQLSPKTDPLWLADSLLPALHGQPLTAAQRELVLSCTREVPPSARLLYAFSLLSRPGNAVRLEILGLGPAEARDYLARVAPHVLPTWAEIAPLLEGTENPHLSFDIGATGEVLPRIGLEGAFPRQPMREPRWAELLGRWVEIGLCSPEKRDAVLGWPGQDSFWTAPDRWPVEAVGVGGACVRFLSHLKVVGEAGRPPQVKAYLGLQHRLRPPRR